MALIRYPILQMAYVVEDVEKACQTWAELFDAGPFHILPHFKSVNGTYRGEATTEDVTHALGYCGDLNIQFTQQHNDVPSVWRDMYPKGREGLHHIMIMPDDIDAELKRFQAAGCVVGAMFDDPMPVSNNSEMITAKVIYLDAVPLIGCFVELFERNDIIVENLKNLKALHEDPEERKNPIRYAM